MGVKQRRVLDILANRGELAGLDIVRASDGEIARGSVYGFLARLERTGYVRSRVAPEIRPRNGLPGKKYAVTERGIALIGERKRRWRDASGGSVPRRIRNSA
jgi:Transcriptional regulator PadR-like family.